MPSNPKRSKDLTKRKKNEQALLEAKERMEQIYRMVPSAIFTVNTNKTITSFNKKAEEITGYSLEEVIGKKCSVFAMNTCTKKCGLFAHDVTKPIMAKECIIRRKDREERVLSKNVDVLRDVQGNIIGGVESFEDITDRKKTEEVLNYMAYYDILTGLPNRTLFTDRLNSAVSYAYRNKEMIAVMFLDLDNFKVINDILGHSVGDQLLQGVAERLIGCLRENDTIARLGGDEFILLAKQINNEDDVVKITEKIREVLKLSFNFDGNELHTTTSIGVSIYPHDGKDSQTLLRNADTALYRAKAQGRDNYQLYTASMNAKTSERLVLENRIYKALAQEEFVIYYQPQVDLVSGEIFGMEALLRWQHPEFGMVYPTEFIPILEDVGLIAPVGEWVLKTACRQNKIWQDAGFPAMRIAINMSPKQFQQQDLVEMVDRVLRETNFSPKRLDIEITENAIIKDIDATATSFRRLKELGVQISIDDFATGYSSLSYLKKFPVNNLKIDQSFIRDITNNSDDVAIVRAIITLAHNFKLKTIAEGVETVEQLEFLRSLKCDAVQGYVVSHPLTAEDATELLSKDIRLCA